MEEKPAAKKASTLTNSTAAMNVSDIKTTTITKTVIHKTIPTTSLQEITEKDRKSMEHLNARFDNYIKRVKLLEEFNKNLMGQLIETHKHLTNESRNIIAEMQPGLSNIRQVLDKTVLDKVVAEIRQRRSNYKTQQMKAKCNAVSEEIEEIREKIAAIQQEKRNLNDEIQYIQTKIMTLTNENDQTKTENNRLENEIERLETELEAEVMSRVRLQTEIQSLEEELPFMRAVFEESINTINRAKHSAVPDTQFYQHELEKAVRELREDFEKQNKAKSLEITEYYEKKIEEIKTSLKAAAADKRNAGEGDTISALQEEIKRSRNDISAMISRNTDLTEQLRLLEEEYEKARVSNQERMQEKLMALDKVHNQIDDITDKYEATLAVKSSLEFEIATYTRLLDEEEARIDELNKMFKFHSGNPTEKKTTEITVTTVEKEYRRTSKEGKDESSGEKTDTKNMTQESTVITTQTTSKSKTIKEKPTYIVKCRCGKNEKLQDETNIIQCDECHVWSHTACYNVKDGVERKRRKFYCDKCYQNMKRQKQ